jgi:DNA polymerase-1
MSILDTVSKEDLLKALAIMHAAGSSIVTKLRDEMRAGEQDEQDDEELDIPAPVKDPEPVKYHPEYFTAWGDQGFAYHGPEVVRHGNDRSSDAADLLHRRLVESRLDTISLDLETVSLKDTTPIGIGIGISQSESFYFPLEPLSPNIPWGLLADPKVKKVWYNSLYDLSVDSPIMDAIDHTNIADAYIASKYLAYPPSLELMAQMFGLPCGNIQKLLKQYHAKDMRQVHPKDTAMKCCLDVEATFGVWEEMKDLIHQESFDVDMKLVPMLADMGKKGLRIDQQLLQKFHDEFQTTMGQLLELCDEMGFNPGSSRQVAVVLMKRGVWVPIKRSKKTKKMNVSTQEDFLKKVDDPLAGLVLQYRKAQKIDGTYIVPILGQERVYTRFGIDAATGRLTSGGARNSTPTHVFENLQNWPSKPPYNYLRNAIIPDGEYFTDYDCSQVELRVLAHLTQDRHMLEIFADPNGDIHQSTADMLGRSRKISKNVNFAALYGADVETLMNTAEITDPDLARKILYEWAHAFPDAWMMIQEWQWEGLHDMAVETLYGRSIPLPNNESEDAIKRKAVNYRIQGSAGEIMKRMMLRTAEIPGIYKDLRIQVHDELMMEGDWKEEILKLDLEHISELVTPINVKLLSRWE